MRKVVLTVALVFGAAIGLNQRTAAGMVSCWNRFGEAIYATSQRYKVDPALSVSMIWWESACNPNAERYEPHVALWPSVRDVSDPKEKRFLASSFGLAQVLGITARGMGFKGTPEEFRKPEVGLEYGVRYLSLKHQQYKDWNLALIAYNGGHGAVLRKQRVGYAGTPELYAKGVWALHKIYGVPIVKKWEELKQEGR